MTDYELEKWSEFGKYIREVRTKKKITMYQIEKDYNFSRQYFSRIELNRHGYALKPELVKRIAQILDINYLELYKIVDYADDKTIAEYYEKNLLNK